jgi:hypothetical protein
MYLKIDKKGDSQYAYIFLNGMLYGRYDMSKDVIINLNNHATAEIKSNKIRMLESDCPDKRCVKQGWSYKTPIVCLPNHIEIEINPLDKPPMHLLY